MDEFDLVIAVGLAIIAVVCCFAVVGIAFMFLRFLG